MGPYRDPRFATESVCIQATEFMQILCGKTQISGGGWGQTYRYAEDLRGFEELARKLVEQNPSNSALSACVRGGFFLRKKPLKGCAFDM